LLHAVDLVDFDAFLVKEDVDDFIWEVLAFGFISRMILSIELRCLSCRATWVPQLLTAPVCCGNVKNAVAYTVACAVQYAGYMLCRLLS
jgi:hypothetical protein